MDKKKIKELAKEFIDKGFEEIDVKALLNKRVEEGSFTQKQADEILDIYRDEFIRVDRTKMSFRDRRILRISLKKLRKMTADFSKECNVLTSKTTKLNKKETKKLEELKNKMITAIVGDLEKNKKGLTDIFEVNDEETGVPINREVLETYEISEIEELLTELLELLEKEV